MSDNKFTDQMNLAKKQLFKLINEQKKKPDFLELDLNGTVSGLIC